MATEIYKNDICLEHFTPPGHPERPDRLRAINEVLEHENFSDLIIKQAQKADENVVLLTHTEAHLDKIKSSIPETGLTTIDGDTSMSPKSFDAALTAIGGTLEAVDHLFAKTCDNAFIATRPPGHHAEKQTAMGFCLFNNVAIAARYAQKTYGIERVAIVDFDVHHGNGTQDIFYDDDSVLFCSTHQMPLWPGSGGKNETGQGNIINAPLSPNDTGDQFREAFTSRVLPALHDAQPELVIISAGFDAHHRDPLAEINLVADDFDWATGKLMDIAGQYADNRLVSVLEGGYDLMGLAESAGAHIYRMMRG